MNSRQSYNIRIYYTNIYLHIVISYISKRYGKRPKTAFQGPARAIKKFGFMVKSFFGPKMTHGLSIEKILETPFRGREKPVFAPGQKRGDLSTPGRSSVYGQINGLPGANSGPSAGTGAKVRRRKVLTGKGLHVADRAKVPQRSGGIIDTEGQRSGPGPGEKSTGGEGPRAGLTKGRGQGPKRAILLVNYLV